MKLSGLFYGVGFLMLAYLVTIPSFKITIIVPVPIPNPLYIFHNFAIIFSILGILCFAYAFWGDRARAEPKSKLPKKPSLKKPENGSLGAILIVAGFVILVFAVYLAMRGGL